jgi:predicted N-acetyltransferase YhbS
VIEVRPIRREEAEQFLELLCDVFGLDLARAHGIFFSEPMFDLTRKWALFDRGQMVSILTTTPLSFGWGKAFGIAGVATRKDRQSEGLGGKLLERVIAESEKVGEEGALLFAKETPLYQRVGFRTLDSVIRADIRSDTSEPGEPLEDEEVREMYRVWSEQHPARLRRDELRWNYWKWHFRICSPIQNGYFCYEPGLLREIVFSGAPQRLPLPDDCEWLGLISMARDLRLNISRPRHELHFMGYNIPMLPQMFMTDQF